MKKPLSKLLCILAVLLLLVWGVSVGVDYYRYTTTLNSAPFSVWIMVRSLEFFLPALIIFLIAWLLERKDKK